jgi:hypothetical protein
MNFLFLVDEAFEVEAKRLLTVSERIHGSISRFAISNDQVNISKILTSNKLSFPRQIMMLMISIYSKNYDLMIFVNS